MTDSIDDKLQRLKEEFDKLLGVSSNIHHIETTTPKQLTQYGLTLDEARDWLEREPNFIPSDDSYHELSNRRKVTRTALDKVFMTMPVIVD